MSDKRPPYHRRPTPPLPRPAVDAPPASARALEQDRIDTLMECPWCSGHGMVTPEKRAEWLEAHPELATKGVVP